MTDRNGVEIDYCPKCRGVWLDRGELDKIIERASSPGASRPEARTSTVEADRNDRDTPSGMFGRVSDAFDRDDDDRGRDGRKRKKRGSFLEDLFDF